MKKSELLLNPYKEHLKKPYLHGAGTLEIDGVQYSADEYITMLEEANKNLKLTLEQMENTCKDYLNDRDTLREENKSLKERIRFLEQCLDNKEKVNKSLREEIKELNKMMLFETKIEQDKDRFIRDRQTGGTLCI